MTSLFSMLRHRGLLFTIGAVSIFAYKVVPTMAQTGAIDNTARGGANVAGEAGEEPLDNVDSNTVTVSASQADLQLTKTGDRAAAEPGDTVIYRLQIRNNGQSPASDVVVTDRLPVGLRFISRSLKGSIGDNSVSFATPDIVENGRGTTVTFGSADTAQPITIPPKEILNVVYAVEVTPDASRGTGRNLAQARAGGLQSNQDSHRLRIRSGILSDCGTLIGRVFVDKNFDGEQQPNEPGVPNAVIYMDDGNRIVTDAKGLYSLANVISGYRSAALDMSSLPGYGLAPNKYFIERNSPSRLVKLAPGSMVRVNFAVTPAFSEDKP